MRILVVADEESKYLWEYYNNTLFDDVEFIISAGDLKATYLSFLTTVTRKCLYYVSGNHDHRYLKEPPYGCDLIDDYIVVNNGIRILGLGGSFRYKIGPFQFNEREMVKRIKKLQVLIDQFNGFDILVTHAPAKGHGDGSDICHTGFEAFNTLIDKYKPSYMLHGHQHLTYSHTISRMLIVDRTTIINGYNYYFFEYTSNGFKMPKTSFLKAIKTKLAFHIKYYGTREMKEYKKYLKYSTS